MLRSECKSYEGSGTSPARNHASGSVSPGSICVRGFINHYGFDTVLTENDIPRKLAIADAVSIERSIGEEKMT